MSISSEIGSRPYWVEKLHQVGWFIPPFVSTGWIRSVAAIIERVGPQFGQPELEHILAAMFTPESLASMVANRYPQKPVIKDFQDIIAEGVEAHFLKLDHIAASGLVPVVEGATRRLARKHGIEVQQFKPTFSALVKHCQDHVTENRIGDVGEITSMLESFELFLSKVLFAKTEDYSLTDGTNRHGMTHGLFADKEFGSPLNFYKIITAINFLTFISSLYYGGSGFAPDETMQSKELASYYRILGQIASERHPSKAR
jgi:hypothetical protein